MCENGTKVESDSRYKPDKYPILSSKSVSSLEYAVIMTCWIHLLKSSDVKFLLGITTRTIFLLVLLMSVFTASKSRTAMLATLFTAPAAFAVVDTSTSSSRALAVAAAMPTIIGLLFALPDLVVTGISYL
jgi:hypothetical protein